MVSGELTIVVSACLLQLPSSDDIIQAVLHAQVGQQHLETKSVKSDIKKQFAWQEKLLFKVQNQRVAHFWLSNQLRKGESDIIGQCIINIEVMNSQKFPLFLYYKDKQTAIIDVEMVMDKKGSKYVQPQKKDKKLILKFTIRSASLVKDMQLFGKMRPTVKVTINGVSHQTYDSKGKNPVWDQEIIFQGVKANEDILFTILDKQFIGKDDIIGTIKTNVDNLKTERTYNSQIKSGGDVVGNLKFDLRQYYE